MGFSPENAYEEYKSSEGKKEEKVYIINLKDK